MVPSSSPSQVRQEVLDAQVALDNGDYHSVRRRLRRITDSGMTVPPELQEDVTKLQRSIGTDPAMKYLAIGCLLFFLVITWHYVF
jgi:hypothetical protein